jgi:putative ABC transport system substrate-binding protein
MMDRRRFLLTSVAGVVAMPHAGAAQQARAVYRIAFIVTAIPLAEMTEDANVLLRSFFSELRRLGYVEGRNLVVERRSALGRPEHFTDIAGEVVRLGPDVIVVSSSRMAVAVKGATSTIPIVGLVTEPVQWGLAASLARPGGNFTGTADPGPVIVGKQLSLLHEVVPKVSRVAFLGHTKGWHDAAGPVLRETAKRLRIEIVLAPMDGPYIDSQYESAFHGMVRNRVQAVVVARIGEHWAKHRLIVDLTARHRLPAIYPWHTPVEGNGLMSYAADTKDEYRALAGYVDRILRGARPGDLPIEEPTRFQLVINLKTAKALGLTIPVSLLARADQVIE